MQTVSAHEAHALLQNGAILIDVREADEHARERIAGAISHPLSQGAPQAPRQAQIIYHCKSGYRTSANAHTLKEAAHASGCEAYLLEGGLEGWKAAGLPLVRDAKAPLDLMRQVQIAAGGLALLGFALGVLIHPAFHLKSGFVAAGLLVAGATGWCGMAKLLAVMPWNRKAA